jgi:hypothetical protein
VTYKGFIREEPLRFDVLVEGCVLVEAKAVAEILPIHKAQLLATSSYLTSPSDCSLILTNSSLWTACIASFCPARTDSSGNGEMNLCTFSVSSVPSCAIVFQTKPTGPDHTLASSI